MLRKRLELLAVAVIATVLLGYGIERASVGTVYADPLAKIRAQDECSYANSALDLAREGGWLTPRLLGRFQLNKPPLLVWLAGFSLKVFGTSLWALRLPGLAAAVCATLVVFWLTRREQPLLAAFAAVALLLSNSLWHIFARLCYTDMLVAASLAGAMAVLYSDPSLAKSRSLCGFAACVAAGVMAKSVAGLLPLFVLALYSVLVRPDKRPSLSRMALVSLLAAALFMPWHVYQLAVHRQWFWADYVQVQLLGWGTQPPGLAVQESQAAFYFKRLALSDPGLAILFLMSLPFLIFSLRGRSQVLPALLTAWFAVVTAALLVHRFQNLPYAISLIPAAAIIIAAYNPIFSARRAKWGILALCAIFVMKCRAPEQIWGLGFGVAEPLPAVSAMRSYYGLGRPNELILADSDDYFYSTTLPLPRLRYYFRVPDDTLRKFIPHYVELGIMLTEDEFERLDQLEPLYAARLRSWGLDSTSPIGTAILGRSDDALLRLVKTRPQSDFYVSGPDLKLLDRDESIRVTHSIRELPYGSAFLLALPERPPRAVAPLPARW